MLLAYKKHVFFEFQPTHSSAAVCEMFRGFSGYIQADAHPIDALFRGDAADDGAASPVEVACWVRLADVFGKPLSPASPSDEGFLRVRKLYELDHAWSKLPPSARLQNRRTVLAPLVDEFFQCSE